MAALQIGISQAQADDGNLADKAVSFLKAEYETNGAPRGMGGFGPYEAYVLKTAGVDLSAWQHNSVALPDAVKDLVQQDINNASGPVKHLAQDLIAMQKLGENNLANQLQTLISNRQNNDGSFQNDTSVYSIIPAYELLGREGTLSIVDSVYAQNYILNIQNGSTGAWADFMVTSQAVRALNYLAPGADPNSPVGQAISSGCDWMKQQQLADGSFKAALDDPLIDTAEAIATQKALGLDPAAAWTNNGKSAVDYLNNNALNADGSFGSSRNVMDASWALDSLTRLGIFPTGSSGGGGGPSSEVSVRVRVEGITSNPVDTTVSVSGTALDALNQAVGGGNVVAPGGFITSINGESGHTGVAANTDTSWFYYVIRNQTIDANSLSSTPGGYNVADGDHIVFYIGAYDSGTYAGKTYLPVVEVSPQAPTAGQTVTINISAQKYDWLSGLQDLSGAEATAVGNYTVQAGGTTYTSSFGQVAIPNAASGTLNYVVTNQNAAGYPNVVPYRGSISMPGTVTADNTTVPISTSAAQCDAPITVNIDAGVNNTKIDVSALVSTNGGTDITQPLPALNINAVVQFQGHPVTVEISWPEGTTISADSSWDGTIQAPSVVNPATLPSSALPAGVNTSSANIIAVGFSDVPLTFSQPVKLVLPGQHGKRVGYIRNNTFTQISTVLNSNTAAALISAGSQDGYYDDGTDITIWTKHFTGFIAYSLSAGGGGALSPTVGVAVVGMNGEKLFGPAYVTVLSTNPWGVTALGALDATGLSYTTSPTWYGFVDSIAGQPGTGTKGWMYTVNGSSPLVLAKDCPIANDDKVIWYYSNSMEQVPPTWQQLLTGTYVPLNKKFITSTNGKATVFPAGGGKIGIGDEACIEIPPDALSGIDELEVSIQKAGSPPAAPQGFKLLGSVFEFSIGGSSSYKFNLPVTLTFSFDLSALPEGQKPSVYYYDASTSKWVELGGAIDGSTITVSVDHFTMFALLGEDMKKPSPTPEPLRAFIDVPASFWAREAIMKMTRLGYVNGYPDGTFKPDNQITRAEFVSILDKLLNLSDYSPLAPDFSDVSSKDWFYQAVENAVYAGIIKGYGRSFSPDRQVTREEAAVILVNALGKQDEAGASMGEKTSFSDDAGISAWARGFVVVAVKYGLIKGYPDGGFKPQGSATRAEACVVFANFLNTK